MLTQYAKKHRAAIVTAATSTLILVAISIVFQTNKETKHMPVNQDIALEAFLVGRYIISLPKDTYFSGAALRIKNIPIDIEPNYSKPRADLDSKKIWETIKNKNLENEEHLAEREVLSENATLFKYDHTRITGEGLDGIPINEVTYSTTAHAWKDNTFFRIGNDSTLKKDIQIKELINNLFSGSDPANTDSLCYVKGCIAQKTGNESVNIHFKLPMSPKLEAQFQSSQYGGEPNKKLSERTISSSSFTAKEEAEWIVNSDYTSHTYKSGERTLQGFDGEEIIEASTQKSEGAYKTQINAQWYYPGVPGASNKPEITIQLNYSYTTKEKPSNPAGFSEKPESGGVAEADFFQVWESALTSFSKR